MSWVVIIVIAVIIGVFAQLVYLQRNKKMISEGKIIKRNISFEEYAEVFTLSNADFAQVVNKLKTMDFSGIGVTWESLGSTKKVIFKSKSSWTAQLNALDNSDSKFRYNFQFTGWQTHKGATWGQDTMNMLLTSIEKAFLSIDPNTQVETSRLKTKTKSSFL